MVGHCQSEGWEIAAILNRISPVRDAFSLQVVCHCTADVITHNSGINSRSVSPLVGDLGTFIFVDSFPNLSSWADTKVAMQSSEGQKIEAELEGVYRMHLQPSLHLHTITRLR